MAIYTHCTAYKLNLAFVSSCKIKSFKNVESYIGEISKFFKCLPKRRIARRSCGSDKPLLSIK